MVVLLTKCHVRYAGYVYADGFPRVSLQPRKQACYWLAPKMHEDVWVVVITDVQELEAVTAALAELKEKGKIKYEVVVEDEDEVEEEVKRAKRKAELSEKLK